MTRTAALLACTIALVAGLAVAGIADAKAKKVISEVEIDAFSVQPPDFDFFFVGDVHSNKPKCEKGRTVNVSYVGPAPPFDIGTTTTDRTGDWELHPELTGQGDYVAVVDRKKIKKGEKKIVCKAATSPEFYFND
jgi:hypothetical protein